MRMWFANSFDWSVFDRRYTQFVDEYVNRGNAAVVDFSSRYDARDGKAAADIKWR